MGMVKKVGVKKEAARGLFFDSYFLSWNIKVGFYRAVTWTVYVWAGATSFSQERR
jgi:hypothetical protein